MPPLHIKRSDAPILSRVRDLFRKRRTVEGNAHDMQEIWKKDRDNLLKEIEKMLESQRAWGNLASPSELQLHITDTYCSASTQTDMPEELFSPAKSRFKDLANKSIIYACSSTQVNLEVAEEESSAIVTQVAGLSLPPRSPSPLSNASGISQNEVPKVEKVANDTFEPDAKRICIPIGKTRSSRSSSSQNISSYPPRLTTNIVRQQRYSIDGESGAIRLWKTSIIPWKGKRVAVRLPPQTFEGNTLHDPGRMPPSDVVARDIEEMRQMLWELEHEADWVTTDEEDKEDYGSDVKSSKGCSQSFNPALFKGAKFF